MGQERLAQVTMTKVMLAIKNAKNGDQNDDILSRAVEEEQGKVILLLLRDPRIDPNQQVLPPWCYKIGLALDECL